MNSIIILVFIQLCGNCYGLYNKQSKIVEPHVETYWESWVESHCPDFACNLADIPITPIGSKHGVNIVNLAFGMPGKSGCDEAQGVPCVLLPGYQECLEPFYFFSNSWINKDYTLHVDNLI